MSGAAAAPPAVAPGLKRGPFSLVAFDIRLVSVNEGLRAGLSVAALVAVNQWLDWPPIMEAALAALLTCLCDAGGPIRRRLPSMLTFAIVGSLFTAGLGLLRGAPLEIVIPLACLGVFCTSIARIYGQAAMQAGNLLTVVLVLSLRAPLIGWREAAELGGMFAAGSLWALLLTLVLWRIYPYGPARRAVGDAWLAMAKLVGDMRAAVNHPSPHESIWDRHARQHRSAVRQSIERARDAVLATVRVRGPISGRAAQSWIRLETADQIFGALIGLSDILAEARDPATRAAADRILRLLRPILVLLAQYTVTDKPDRLSRFDRAIKDMAATATTLPDATLRGMVDVIVDRLRIAVTLAAPGGVVPGGGDTPPPPLRERIGGPLRANLDWNSEALRHALRSAAMAFPAFVITLGWPTEYGHWLTIVLVMTMQPYFALTFTRALERIAGTLAGGALAAALAWVCTTPVSIAVALFPLAVISLSLRAVSFGLFITCLTPLVVLLSEIGRPGESELTIALMRGLYTVVGGLLAIAGCFLLWPSWEPNRLARELRGAVAAHGRYAHAEIESLLGEASAATVEQMRRAAGMASNNAEASLQRALLEPGQAGPTRIEAALTIDAALRRMAGRLSALQLDAHHATHDAESWHGWRDWIDAAATRLAAGETDLPPRPPIPRSDPHADALTRIARQLELVASAMSRLD